MEAGEADKDGKGTQADSRKTVFFSYSRTDKKAALPIIALLEDAGFGTWWDGNLEAGVDYVESTEQALESASAVVVLWSAQSVGSNWVRDEAMSGRARNCLVPISLDGSMAPLGFRQFQALDFSDWTGSIAEPVAKELVRAVGALHGGSAPVLPERVSTVTSPTRRNLLLVGLGGAVVIGGGLAGLAHFAGVFGGSEANSIVVLPFYDDSPDQGQDFLAAGIASELRSMLTRNPAIRVIARSTSEAVLERSQDAVAIASELGVSFVVEGSVRIVDEVVHITSSLVDGADGVARWSETYSQPLEQLLVMRDQLTSAISTQLSIHMEQDQSDLQLGAATVPAAYEDYLRGWDAYVAANGHEGFLGVLALFENAARLDPGFAGAWAGQAAALTSLGHTAYSADDAAGYYARAQQAAQRAIEASPGLGEAHSLLGVILFETQLNPQDAAPYYQRSIELEPGNAVIEGRFAEFSALTGRDEQALRAITTSLNLDPLNPTIYKAAALVHYSARRFDEAINLHRQALTMNPGLGGSHSFIGNALVAQGDFAGAIEACSQEPSAFLRAACLAIAQHKAGSLDAARQAMADLIENYGDASLYQQAQVLAQWGQPNEAMARLQQALVSGDAGLNYLRMDPMLDPLRERADFIDLRTRLGFT